MIQYIHLESCLVKRDGVATTYSLHGHAWQGEKVSGSWVRIVNAAKHRMKELKNADADNQPISESAAKFLKEKTHNRKFFTNESSAKEESKPVPRNRRR
jgi:hypothetical protein